MSVVEIYNEIAYSPHNITISGGDPLIQWVELKQLLKLINRESCKTIWIYTGFTWEDLSTYKQLELAEYIDVLVDGRFEIDKKDLTLPFRGSSNQRLIDVKKSVKANKVVLWEVDNEK